ncbi:DUF2553 family protein [Caldalkalibacillus mannanilyticus]|uniref:DUF2553 family protein n=1 Tax=Caldalkalibacillus mannanilyticus TaxID=1418 RepID=UPI00046A5487|nr:DUF2553 family protein [Caldalkalibacillus mannanilyticus]
MEQTGRRKKVDITSKVTGTIVGNQMILYVGERAIGQMNLAYFEPEFTFEPDFGYENNKVYQIQEVGVEDDQYVSGCDMGWC